MVLKRERMTASLQSINPYSGEIISEYTTLSSLEIADKLTFSEKAFQVHKHSSIEERANKMMTLSKLLLQEKDVLATLISNEMGKLMEEAKAEVKKCASVCEFYAKQTADFLKDQKMASGNSQSYVVYQPIGTVLAVMPWNFPFWQVFRFAAPAVMAGNVGVLKHASNVSGCALAIEELFEEAGFEKGVFQSLLITSSQVEEVIANPIVKAITLTGSEKAGASVAALAGKYLKKSVLELGGSDPFIVLEDADLEYTVSMAMKSRFMNCGQSCIAAKRFLVPKKLKNKFLGLLMEKVESITLSDPIENTTNLGPMARLDLLQELDRQVDESVQQGAVLISGGAAFDETKCLYMPTILSDVKKGMPAYDEELFGPVASVIIYQTEEEMLEIANDTPYGLGASIWTSDIAKAKQLALKIDSGAVFINEMVKSDPRLPFGGVKLSGYGRELSREGMLEFMNQKTVVVK